MSLLETSGAVATQTADSSDALLGLKIGQYVPVQGVPTIRIAKVQSETIIQRILHAQHVTPLRSREADVV